MPSPVRFVELRKYLEQHGWTLVPIHGSHHTFAKSGEQRPITVPVHGGKVDYIYVRQAKRRCEGD